MVDWGSWVVLAWATYAVAFGLGVAAGWLLRRLLRG